MTDQQLRERVVSEDASQWLRELDQKLRRLGDKFGGYSESFALPSMTEVLMDDFGMAFVGPLAKVWRKGRTMQVDVLAYSDSAAYVVQVKSRLGEESLDQMREILRDFRELFTEHADKKLYGILAAGDLSGDLRDAVLREGIYLARIHDDEFEITVPEGFQPRAY